MKTIQLYELLNYSTGLLACLHAIVLPLAGFYCRLYILDLDFYFENVMGTRESFQQVIHLA